MLSMRSSQRPVRVSRSFSISLPASARMKVRAMVATGRGIGIGVLVTTMPGVGHRRHVDRVVADAMAGDDAQAAIGAGDRGAPARARGSRTARRSAPRVPAAISRTMAGRYSHSRPGASSRIFSAAWPNAGSPRESRMSRVMPTRNCRGHRVRPPVGAGRRGRRAARCPASPGRGRRRTGESRCAVYSRAQASSVARNAAVLPAFSQAATMRFTAAR